MSALPGTILAEPRWRAIDGNGVPINGAKLFSYEPGGSLTTPKSLYTTAALNVAHTNPIVSDASGLFASIFLGVDGYDLVLKSNDLATTYWTCLSVEGIGQTFLAQLGSQLASGTEDVASGYQILTSDFFVSSSAVDATNPFIFNLPARASSTQPLCIKHQTTNAARVTPSGADKIENVAAYYALPAASSPSFPTIWLIPGSASWRIVASHKVP